MAKKKLITPEELDNLASLGDPQISPDGTQVLYVNKRVQEGVSHSTIWLASSKGKTAVLLNELSSF